MPAKDGLHLAVRHIATPGLAANRILRLGLAFVALAICLRAWLVLTSDGLMSVDLEIPLRAAARFAVGGQPYLASSFAVARGPGLPFLYPPYVLPFLVPLLQVPQASLLALWFGICLTAAVFACRRLAIRPSVVPFVMIWPPFWEGIWHGNAEILIFAAFVLLYYHRPVGTSMHPVGRSVGSKHGSTIRDGLLAAATGVIKPSEGWAWLNVLRHHPRAAISGALLVVAVMLATLPIVGIGSWLAYGDQLRRAADPNWAPAAELAGLLPGWPSTLTAVATLILAIFVPGESTGAWLGLLNIIGTPKLHGYGFIYLLPAFVRIRREIALVAAIFEATSTLPLIWLAVLMTALAMLLGSRFPALLEPQT